MTRLSKLRQIKAAKLECIPCQGAKLLFLTTGNVAFVIAAWHFLIKWRKDWGTDRNTRETKTARKYLARTNNNYAT